MRKLGVIGSLVWDRIHGRDPVQPPVEEWGGIAYALAGLDAALPVTWEIVPLIKVGRDLAPEATALYRTLDRLTPGARPIEVPHPNNRVVLHYQSQHRRCERMSGGVPSWSWPELGPMLADLDALYINFVSGFELSLETATAIRAAFAGPIYADLHSLFLGIERDGTRSLQPLPEAPTWFGLFDAVQMNEEELEQFGAEPLAVAASAIGAGASLLNVTVGPRGVIYFARPGFERLADLGRAGASSSIRTSRMAPPDVEAIDPTGCGDVFGATCCARLLAGDTLHEALDAANRAAARTATFRGAGALAPYLRGQPVVA